VRVLVVRHPDGGDPGVLEERVRAAGHELVFCDPHAGEALPAAGDYDAIVVLGGSANVEEGHRYLRDEIAYLAGAGVPVLGVCLGSQLLAAATGGKVVRATRPEIGWFEVELTPEGLDDPLLGALPPRFTAYQWHSYAFEVPPGATELARSEVCPQAFRAGERSWGVQFHPEVTAEVLEDWFADFRSDGDAVRLGFDPDGARAELADRLPVWNELGGRLFDRFLQLAGRVRQTA
jgi:GMP synthase-like glutamine amidotransferase